MTGTLEYFDPYSSAQALFLAQPDWMPEADARRVAAYGVYEAIYRNVPETFRLVFRGAENQAIYVPNARTICDTTNRYIATGMGFVIDPDVSTPADQELFRSALTALFNREKFHSKFNTLKKWGIIRGDALFHVTANPAKAPGTRLKITTIDPAAYFPVTHPDDPDRIIGVHIVEQIVDGDETRIKRQTYKRGADPLNNDGSDTTIYSSSAIFDPEEWLNFDANPIRTLIDEFPLPAQITAIPVYHFKNIEGDGDPFGTSELQGFERIMTAVNQAVSDEELALALEGLGLYHTDAGPPKDENGNTVNWRLGPGRVVEHPPGTNFQRVSGISSVTPYQDHLSFLIQSIREASATPDVAIGKVDVSVAESGISLKMQMGPMLAKAAERDQTIGDTLTQMWYDLKGWFAAYEGLVTEAYAYPTFGDKLPSDDAAEITRILAMVTAGVASAEWARNELAKYGYVFPDDEAATITTEAQARTTATDAWAIRAAGELLNESPNGLPVGG